MRVSTGREQQHRPANGAAQLVLADLHLRARDPSEQCACVVAARRRLDLLEPAPVQDDVAGRSPGSVASPA